MQGFGTDNGVYLSISGLRMTVLPVVSGDLVMSCGGQLRHMSSPASRESRCQFPEIIKLRHGTISGFDEIHWNW
jgi:hypothetical protein